MAGSPERAGGIRPHDLVAAAWAGVRLHRTRAALTVTSFAAGTAAAISLLTITEGARAELLARIERLGADLVRIHAVGAPGRSAPPALTLADAEVIGRTLPFARDVAPVRIVPASVLLPDEQLTVQVVGTTPDYFALRGLEFARGRPFSSDESRDGRAVCVAGDATARTLGADGAVYGSWVKVGRRWCRLVGILRSETATTGENADRRLYVPIRSTLRGDLSDRQAVGEILLRVGTGTDPTRAARVMERALRRRHEGAEHFAIETAQALLRQGRRTRGLLDVLLGSIAALALGLGGIALGSQSWQSVSLRRSEIAIRRAIGARREEILLQFLLEGAVLASAGAAAGLVLGLAGSGVAAAVGGWPWTLALGPLTGAVALIVALGLVCTAYPAVHAATLDPVTALRQER